MLLSFRKHGIWKWRHCFLCLPGSVMASQKTAISGSFQQNLAGMCSSVCLWWLIMGWTPGLGSLWMVHPFVLARNSVSVTFSMGILFAILRRNEVFMLWSSFLMFLCFANCTLGMLSFWANIHLSVSAYHVSSFVIGLPHSGWYPPDPSDCLRIS